MRHLPKSLRPNWRYLAVIFESGPETTLTHDSVQTALRRELDGLYGDATAAVVDLSVLELSARAGGATAVVRCRRGAVDRARAAISCLSQIDADRVRPYVAGISGTVRGCEEKYLSRPRPSMEERTVVFEGEARRGMTRGDRVDVRVDASTVGATNLDTTTY